LSIRATLVVAIAASMAAMAIAAGALVRAAGERNVERAAEQAVAAAAQALAAAERADVEKLDATLRVLSAHPGLREAFAARDRAGLLSLAAPVFEQLRAEHDITHLYFLEPSGTCFLRVHRPELSGDVVARATFARAVETGRIGAGMELGRTAFALRVVRPWRGPDGSVVGYLELAEEIDHFLERMKAQTGDEYALLVGKAFLDDKAWVQERSGGRNGWGDDPATVVVDTTTRDELAFGFDGELSSVPERGLVLGEMVQGGATFVRGIVPVTDAARRRVGGVLVLHEITALRDSMLAARRGIYGVILAVASGLGGFLLVVANRLVFRRLDRLIASMEDLSARLEAGDHDVVAPRPSADDELGRFEELFGRFLRSVARVLKERRGA
jgi:HAMP domain-containing protein